MQWIMVATPPFGSVEQVKEVIGHLPANPAGLEARFVGTADDGKPRVVTLWESKADAERFLTEDLAPALAKVLGPEPIGAPETVGIAVADSYARQPVG